MLRAGLPSTLGVSGTEGEADFIAANVSFAAVNCVELECVHPHMHAHPMMQI
jgi:hypothetical protein